MSDEFDKEAEKEKLRQQLAEEEADRQATQHMSDLLLKGATMTNKHCDECGDPIFRHEGREFCPTCGAGASSGAASAESADTAAEETAGDGGTTTAETGQPSAPSAPAAGTSQGSQGQSPPTPAGDADLPAARMALARKVTALAQEAEATDDVGRARELLAAVREGAEAIRALDSTGR